MIPFSLGEVETLPDFSLRALSIRSELVSVKDQTGQINKLTGKYIMEMPNMKHIQLCMTYFEIYFIRFECQPQSDQLSIILTPSIELIFKNLETSDIEMNPSHSIIEPIVNRKSGNTFHH